MHCAQVRAPVGQGVSVVQGGSKRLQEPNWKEQRGLDSQDRNKYKTEVLTIATTGYL